MVDSVGAARARQSGFLASWTAMSRPAGQARFYSQMQVVLLASEFDGFVKGARVTLCVPAFLSSIHDANRQLRPLEQNPITLAHSQRL